MFSMDESVRKKVFPLVPANPASFMGICLTFGVIVLGLAFSQQIFQPSSLWGWSYAVASVEKFFHGKTNGWRLQMIWFPSMPSLNGLRRRRWDDIEYASGGGLTEAGDDFG